MAVSGLEDLHWELPARALHCCELQVAVSGFEDLHCLELQVADLHWELASLAFNCHELQVAVSGFEDLRFELASLVPVHCGWLQVAVPAFGDAC